MDDSASIAGLRHMKVHVNVTAQARCAVDETL